MKPLLVLRPQPGADETAARALSLALEPKVIPLFQVQHVSWSLDSSIPYDAVFITSSNALNIIDSQIEFLSSLPALCVGEATAAAARRVGWTDVITGDHGAASLADLAASLGHRHLLWLAGHPSMPVNHPDLIFDVKIVYKTVELPVSKQLEKLTISPAVALVHSPRAAQFFARMIDRRDRIDLVAISEKAALAAGPGWASVRWPETPLDSAMLEIAAPLCRAGETGTSA